MSTLARGEFQQNRAMLTIPRVKREVIDGWPIADAGLTVRVVNSLTAAGVATIGALRGWPDAKLIGLRSLGRVSLMRIRAFFRICAAIEQGRQQFQSIDEALRLFLDEDEFRVISGRYGFAGSHPQVLRNAATLQQIADQTQKTRERIRQIEETATARLTSRLAAVCLGPFQTYFADYINTRGRIVTAAELEPLRSDPLLGGHNPAAVLRLLGIQAKPPVVFYNNLFSTLPLATLQTIEQAGRDLLAREAQPLTLDKLAAGLPTLPPPADPVTAAHALGLLLNHAAGVAATVDHRFFLYTQGAQAFLVEIMRRIKRPAHYRAITAAFNEQLQPHCRKGAGFILDLLNADPRFIRADRGIYDLKA